ncbi:MAG: helix-turn-helix domain-containing protein [Vibrio gallaecicus]
MSISKDMKRKFDLINALSRIQRPSLHSLHQTTKIPESTIKRQLASIRTEFGMRILFVRESGGERGTSGYYMLTNWGVIDRDEFFKHYMKLKTP